jgi:hypothetical protein
MADNNISKRLSEVPGNSRQRLRRVCSSSNLRLSTVDNQEFLQVTESIQTFCTNRVEEWSMASNIPAHRTNHRQQARADDFFESTRLGNQKLAYTMADIEKSYNSLEDSINAPTEHPSIGQIQPSGFLESKDVERRVLPQTPGYIPYCPSQYYMNDRQHAFNIPPRPLTSQQEVVEVSPERRKSGRKQPLATSLMIVSAPSNLNHRHLNKSLPATPASGEQIATPSLVTRKSDQRLSHTKAFVPSTHAPFKMDHLYPYPGNLAPIPYLIPQTSEECRDVWDRKSSARTKFIRINGPQANRYRAEAFLQQPREEIPEKPLNKLSKPRSRRTKQQHLSRDGHLLGQSPNKTKGAVISEPSKPTHFMIAEYGFAIEQLERSAVLQTISRPPVHKQRRDAMAIASLVSADQLAKASAQMDESGNEQDNCFIGQLRGELIHAVFNPQHIPNVIGAVKQEIALHHVELKLAKEYSDLYQILYERMKGELVTTRQTLATVEHQLALQGVELNRAKKFIDHYQMLYERNVKEVDRLLKQLQDQKEEEEEIWALKVEGDGDEVNPESPETPPGVADSTELPFLTNARGESKETSNAGEQRQEAPVTTSHEVSTSSNALLSFDTCVESACVIDERPETPSHGEVLRPDQEMSDGFSEDTDRGEDTPREEQLNDEEGTGSDWLEPGSDWSDDSSDDSDESSDESNEGNDDGTFESPSSPSPPLDFEGASQSSFNLSLCDIDTDSNAESLEVLKHPPSPSMLSLPNFDLSSSYEDKQESEGYARVTGAFDHFLISRIEAMPPVFRRRILGATLDELFSTAGSESSVLDLAMKMDAWEWCSIPDLELKDPRK